MQSGAQSPTKNQPDIIIPAPLNSVERQQDLNEFMNGIYRADLDCLSRCFNHATLGQKVYDFIAKNFFYPKHDLTLEEANIFNNAVLEPELLVETIIDSNGNLKPYLKNTLPPKVYSMLGSSISQIYSLAFQAIYDETDDFQPWLYEFLGRDKLAATSRISKETIRDFLIIGAIQCITDTIKSPAYPNFVAVVDKIITLQNNIIKECRTVLNDMKTEINNKPAQSFMRGIGDSVHQASEVAFTSLLRKPKQFGYIPILSKAAQKVNEVIQAPSKQTIRELGKIASQAPGHSGPLKIFFGTLFILGGIATIGLGIAGIPFTGGLSVAGMVTIGSVALSYITGGLGAISGASLLYSGKQKGYSQTLSTFANKANKSNVDSEQEPLLNKYR